MLTMTKERMDKVGETKASLGLSEGQWNRRVKNGHNVRRVTAAAALLLILWTSSVVAQPALPPQSAAIKGTVRDGAGVPVSDALVRLEREGAAPLETKTKSDGSYAFAEIASGSYVVTAGKAGLSGPGVAALARPPEVRQVDLTLDWSISAKPKALSSSSPAPPMEFADTPNFTIAAVTDWTAAGGHGSDAVLRTSEALNRETITLKPNGIGIGGSDSNSEPGESESTLRAAVASAPRDFRGNHRLGAFYLHAERFADSIEPLQTAYKIDPKNFDNAYDLALALKGNGDLVRAREHVQTLLVNHESPDVHRLAGEVDEKLNDPLDAVHQFEQAVRGDPSEQNYFEWGSELLLHRAVWQAKDVFSAGVKAYPKSGRMLTALGAALFAGALYDEAAQRLCEASELNPADPEPYRFMGKIELAAPNPLACVEEKLARFVDQRPGDALANYLYAMAMWKQKGQSIDAATLERVQNMLTKATTIDPKCSDAYLQLGVLQSTRRDYAKAIEFYRKAIEADPQLSEAHYRLAVAYDRVGDKEKAQKEFQLHDEIEKQQAAVVEKQRREVKQFLVVVDGKTADR
jgi:tetratricopeptide (TPR) repeat protein